MQTIVQRTLKFNKQNPFMAILSLFNYLSAFLSNLITIKMAFKTSKPR